MNELIAFLKKNFPNNAEQIQTNLNRLCNCCKKAKFEIDKAIPTLKRDYAKIGEYYSMSTELQNIQDQLEKICLEFNQREKFSPNNTPSKSNTSFSEKKDKIHNSSHISMNKESSISTTKREFPTSNVKSNPNDYRFIKDPFVRQSDPAMDGLSKKIGTPSHIEFLHMKEDDSRRHKSRCAKYDKVKSLCTCASSPYYLLKCGGSSHCEYYEEMVQNVNTEIHEETTSKKPKIKVLSKNKIGLCPTCKRATQKEKLIVNYFDNGERKQSLLASYYCSLCKSSYILDTIYSTYTFGKNKKNIDVEFVRIF